MSQDDVNVVKPDFGTPRLTIKDRRVRCCKHIRVEVDEELRTVTCTECGTVLDPITVLIGFAVKERHLQYTKSKMDSLSNTILEMKAEERRIKQRIRTAKQGLPKGE